jgi:hypothetical protein
MDTTFDELVQEWKNRLFSNYLNMVRNNQSIEYISEMGMKLHVDFVSMDRVSIRYGVSREDHRILGKIYDRYLGLYLDEMDKLLNEGAKMGKKLDARIVELLTKDDLTMGESKELFVLLCDKIDLMEG